MDEASCNQDLLNSLCLFTTISDPDLRLIPLNIFTVAAYTNPPEAAHRITNAMSYLQNVLEEESRFDNFIKMMASECRNVRDLTPNGAGKSLSIVIDGLIFINSILDNLDDNEVRIHIRNQIYRKPFRSEFQALGEIMEPAISRQLDIFRALLQTDSEWMMEQYNRPTKAFISTRDLFDILIESVKGSEGITAITQLLQHLLCIRADSSIRTKYVRFLDKTLEQVLLANRGIDPDFCSSPTPYLTVKELERILYKDDLDCLRQENMRLKFELVSMDDQKMHLAKSVEMNQMLQKQVKDLSTELDQVKRQSEKDIEYSKRVMNDMSSNLYGKFEKAQCRIVELENQVISHPLTLF